VYLNSELTEFIQHMRLGQAKIKLKQAHRDVASFRRNNSARIDGSQTVIDCCVDYLKSDYTSKPVPFDPVFQNFMPVRPEAQLHFKVILHTQTSVIVLPDLIVPLRT